MIDAKLQRLMLRSIGVGVLASGVVLIAGEPANTVAGAANKPVTFTKDIVPIFQEKCQDCHRKDSMAPMSLVTYEETRGHAPDAAVASRQNCRHSALPERSVTERRASRNDRSLGGCRCAARR